MIKSETLSKLIDSKLCIESEAFTNGEYQATSLIENSPDYDFFCELYDDAKSWRDDKEICLNYIDLGDNPSALNYHIIDGFNTAILDIHSQLQAAQYE